MGSFPTLGTGAVAQYPLERSVRFSTRSVRFLDGTQQRFPLFGSGLRRWTVKLDCLNEQELSAVISFADAQGSASFTFTDPLTGVAVAGCIIAGGAFTAGMSREMCGETTLVIEEKA
jgi:hypothetical protein